MIVFALLALIVGPGLIVNLIPKDNRDLARPGDIVEFEGDRQFLPTWVISDQCETDCSFVSGHASIGFYAMILGWLLASRSWLMTGIEFGLLMSMVLIIQGGHFLSDVLLAGFIIYFVIVFLPDTLISQIQNNCANTLQQAANTGTIKQWPSGCDSSYKIKYSAL